MEQVYDIAVIGGGVVGCAILYELTCSGYKCLLLEKNQNLASGASSGNSGMLHTGFDSIPGTLEDKLIHRSLPLMRQYLSKYNIPNKQCGAVMIARDDKQLKQVTEIFNTARKKGIENMELLSADQIKTLEPNLNMNMVQGGLLLKEEMVLDSCLYTISLAHNALRNGAKILNNTELASAVQDPTGQWCLNMKMKNTLPSDVKIKPAIPLPQVKSRIVINASGLFGDHVDEVGLGKASFRIAPKKGEYAVFGKDAGKLIQHIILPVPTENYKGVLVFPSVYGNLVIGPTKVATLEKEQPTNSNKVIGELVKHGEIVIPKLREFQLADKYAGVRPATQFSDYQIITDAKKNWITVGGIRSTGLTASRGISQYVQDIITSRLLCAPSLRPIEVNDRKSTWWPRNEESYVMDGADYKITHKLMRIGLSKKAKL